jgi:hypothetical protein
MSDKRLLQELRRAVGRHHQVGLGDVGGWIGEGVGGWIGEGDLARAGFWDGQQHRSRSFAGVIDGAGRVTWWEVADEAGCQAVAA